jgi:hypothetical protein
VSINEQHLQQQQQQSSQWSASDTTVDANQWRTDYFSATAARPVGSNHQQITAVLFKENTSRIYL